MEDVLNNQFTKAPNVKCRSARFFYNLTEPHRVKQSDVMCFIHRGIQGCKIIQT
jgi:hypothetical protein